MFFRDSELNFPKIVRVCIFNLCSPVSGLTDCSSCVEYILKLIMLTQIYLWMLAHISSTEYKEGYNHPSNFMTVVKELLTTYQSSTCSYHKSEYVQLQVHFRLGYPAAPCGTITVIFLSSLKKWQDYFRLLWLEVAEGKWNKVLHTWVWTLLHVVRCEPAVTADRGFSKRQQPCTNGCAHYRLLALPATLFYIHTKVNTSCYHSFGSSGNA